MTRDVLIARWTEIGDKIVKLAEEFPDAKYDYRPAAEVRTFADQLRHVGFWNIYVAKTLRREPADGEANELPREKYSTKAKIVAAMRKTFDDVKGQLAKGGTTTEESDLDTMVAFVGHSGEHYGQLVLYYRLNGLVPPASR